MRDFLIRLLFRLLGNDYTRQYNIPYLFGAHSGTHAQRLARWQHALVRLYKDKDMLDFCFYQAESDKENVFKGKIDPNLARGARLRTLFIVYSARKAYELSRKGKAANVNDASAIQEDVEELDKAYKSVTDIHKAQ